MRKDQRRSLLAVACVAVLAGGLVALRLLAPSGEPSAAASPRTTTISAAGDSLRLRVEVRSVVPHEQTAFTQGLLWHDGRLYESTGQYGSSGLRRIDPASGRVEKSVQLPSNLFGEGLARVGDRLFQLTWRAGIAITYDLSSFEETGRLRYAGQGWGLCFDGRWLVMSDGSETLVRRDPETFAEIDRLRVTFQGRPVTNLNELEFAEGWIYANVWQSDSIVRIDPVTGTVRAVIDASGLLSPEERTAAGVLNGIAYQPRSSTFWLTGKLWPRLFEVVFVEEKSRLSG